MFDVLRADYFASNGLFDELCSYIQQLCGVQAYWEYSKRLRRYQTLMLSVLSAQLSSMVLPACLSAND